MEGQCCNDSIILKTIASDAKLCFYTKCVHSPLATGKVTGPYLAVRHLWPEGHKQGHVSTCLLASPALTRLMGSHWGVPK